MTYTHIGFTVDDRDYFNVYRIEIVSGVSGTSCDPEDGNVMRDTPLHLTYATRVHVSVFA